MTTNTLTLQSNKTNLADTRWVQQTLPEPASGEVRVRIAHFAVTANNITYGVAGDSIGYWRFFPADEGWGCIPVWGIGEVEASAHPGVAVGARVYGYFPMATHVMLRPERVGPHGFVDGAEHRSGLPPIYNQYVLTAADPGYRADREAEQMLYRPLFTTSFLIDDWLADNNFFGAAQIVLTSASSKTSIGLAHLLSRRDDGPAVVGITSTSNRAFVAGLGCYDSVITYDEVDALPAERSVLVDMAGSGRVRRLVHERLGDQLQFSSSVGATHWEDATIGAGSQNLPGPAPSLFFAPSQAEKRLADWGREAFEARLATAWEGFLQAAEDWIDVERCEGPDALERVYAAFVSGSADPSKGYVASL